MYKVQILDRCPQCNGEAMVFVGMDYYHDGKPFDRYRPCCGCFGSGKKPR